MNGRSQSLLLAIIVTGFGGPRRPEIVPLAARNAILAAHPDLYERSHGAVRPMIKEGSMQTGSLDCPGYASGAMPDWNSMRRMA